MPCTLRSRVDVADVVLAYFRRRRRDPTIRRSTKISTFRLSAHQKDSYHRGIGRKIRTYGCSMAGFTRIEFRSQKTVGDVIGKAWEAVDENS